MSRKFVKTVVILILLAFLLTSIGIAYLSFANNV